MPVGTGNIPITRDNFDSVYVPGLAAVFFNEVEYEDRKIIEVLFNTDDSDRRYEEEIMISGLGQAFPIEEGGDPTYDSMSEAWKVRYTMQAMGLAIEFTHEAQVDNLYFKVGEKGAQELGRTLMIARQVMPMAMFNDSTRTIYAYNGSNYALLGTSLPLTTGGTWRNTLTNFTPLSQGNLEAAIQRWTNEMVDLRGNLLRVEPVEIWNSPKDRFLVDRLIHSTQRAQEANNDINPLNKLNMTSQTIPWFTDDGRYFLAGPKRRRGLKFYDREAAMFKRVDSGSNWNKRVMGYERFQFGALHNQAISGSWQ